jgi:hypothetical protein
MDFLFNRSPAIAANTPVQPAMELATSRVLGVSHWISANRNVKIGLAIAVPSLILLLSTTPVADGLTKTWRRVTGQTKVEKTRPERGESRTYDKPPELPKKSYGHLPSGKKTARQERSEQGMSSNNNNKTIINDITNRPQSPKKSYAAAVSAVPACYEPVIPLTPDDASFNSDASSEHSHKQKFRLGQNIKKRWQNRPFGHSSSENVMSP